MSNLRFVLDGGDCYIWCVENFRRVCFHPYFSFATISVNRATTALLLAWVAFVAIPATVAQSARPAPTPKEVTQGYSDRYFVARIAQGKQIDEFESVEKAASVKLFETFGRLRVLEVFDPNVMTARVVIARNRLEFQRVYDLVTLDCISKAAAGPSKPDDPLFDEQWSLYNDGRNGRIKGADIHAIPAWQINRDASDVVVAVIDSGALLTHEDLQHCLWCNPGEIAANGKDDDHNGYVDDVHGMNTYFPLGVMGNGDPRESDNHGTGIASIIGAEGGNHKGMTGVAWHTRLMILRFLYSDLSGYASDEIRCLQYAVSNGAQIINASYTTDTRSDPQQRQLLFDEYRHARDRGIIIVAAAGNEGLASDQDDLDNPLYPASALLDNIIAVAATNTQDEWSDTSYGSGLVEIGAPGVYIRMASSDGGYRFNDGTSFAAPIVTGAVALLKQKFPSDHYRDTMNRLLRGTDGLSDASKWVATGGRLNLEKALGTDYHMQHVPPFNDDFQQRVQLRFKQQQWVDGKTKELLARGSSQFATRENGEPAHAGASDGSASVWWSWKAPRGGTVTLDTDGSGFDTLLGVYTGTMIGALNAVALVNRTGHSVTFIATQDTCYEIAVDGKSGASGPVVLHLTFTPTQRDGQSAVGNLSGHGSPSSKH